MICENCGIRPASVQVSQQQGGQRQMVYLCTQCARQLGMIGGGGFEGANPFEMLQYLVQQQNQGPGNFFEALSGEAREAVMRPISVPSAARAFRPTRPLSSTPRTSYLHFDVRYPYLPRSSLLYAILIY